MKRSLFAFVILCVGAGILAAAGCREPRMKDPAKAEPGRTLLIGLIPEQNIFRQMERYEPLAAYLSKKTGMHIKLTVLTRYGNILDNFLEVGMDGAFFGSFTYALAHARLGVEVIARPETPAGESTYHGLIFVRKDSGIASARQMRGKRFALVDRATTAGYLLPLAYFKKHGVDLRTGLRETYFSGTHEDTILDVLNRKADIGAAKNTVFERLAANDMRVRRDLVVLEQSPDVPENALAVRKDLDTTVKQKLRKALLTIQNDSEGRAVLETFGARKFIPTTDSDYEPVYRYARQIGLNLGNYNYQND
ncbi:MAG: hypothetical protein A2010_02360 [Nitrospirae bacterium GWD2_57_9]|nr:MAG: hypothetical protein A2010_02360 [Nitrospirae bacterium GWD2_57_9]